MKVGDLVRMRSGKLRLISGEKIDERGIKMYVTLMSGQYYTVPQTLLRTYGKVITNENTSSV